MGMRAPSMSTMSTVPPPPQPSRQAPVPQGVVVDSAIALVDHGSGHVTGLTQDTDSMELDQAADTPATTLLGLAEKNLHALMEDELLANAVVTAARCSTGQQSRGDWAAGLPTTWEALEGMLRSLSLLWDATDPWTTLGLLTMEGTAPTAIDLDRRLHRARILLSITAMDGWEEWEVEHAQTASDRFVAAHAQCLEQLSSVQARRRRDKGAAIDAWRELEPPSLTFIADTAASEG